MPDFTLFSLDEQPFTLYEQLSQGKPLLLITGSYTCDITRANLPAIQNLYRQYGQDLAMYMIYTLEAHPVDGVSPYSPEDKIWIMPANVRDSVEASQPQTYGERVPLARFWQQRYGIQVPILMDTPDNLFWKGFGQAPNMAYLIKPTGEVYFRQIWFEQAAILEPIVTCLK